MEAQFRQARLLARSEAHHIAIGQEQLPYPAAAPPEAIGGTAVLQQPLAPPLLQQGVVFADGRVDQADFLVAVAAKAVGAAMQVKALAGLAWNEQLEPFAALGLASGEPLAQPFNEGRGHGAAVGRRRSRSPPG